MAITSLRELELEYQMGKLSEEDYSELRDQYRRRAIALLKATDSEEGNIDSAIEAEVRRLRQALAGNGRDPRKLALVCLYCDQSVGPNDKFCPSCGRPLVATKTPQVLKASPIPRQAKTGPGASISARAKVWLMGGASLAVVFTVGVGGLYYASSRAQKEQRPMGQVVAQDYHVIAVDPASPSTLYLGHHNGIQMSADGGSTWMPISDVQSDIMSVIPGTPREGAMIASGHGVFIKKDSQDSPWTPVSHNLPGDDIHAMARHPENSSIIYAFVVGHGLFMSQDGGANWKPLSDRPLTAEVTGITVVPGAVDLLYVSTAGGGVMASGDGGRTWEGANGFVNGALPTTNLTSISGDPGSGDVFTSAAGSFNGALYVGSTSGVFKSTDGGNSWLRLTLESDAAAITIGTPGSQQIYVVNRSGQIFLSRDGGITWRGKE